jgi:hypothetical protein
VWEGKAERKGEREGERPRERETWGEREEGRGFFSVVCIFKISISFAVCCRLTMRNTKHKQVMHLWKNDE